MVRDEEYLWAEGPRANGSIPLERVGKWLLMGVRRQDVDDVWLTVKGLTERDKLGHRSKVSTAFVSPLSHTPGDHVVVVYSKDWRDTTELRRMLVVLREHGEVPQE